MREGGPEPLAVTEARRWGLPAPAVAAIAAQLASPTEADEGLWLENVAAVDAFLACDTQWRTAAVAGGLAPGRIVFIGLDYAGARAGIEAAGIALTPEIWEGVRIMEAEARDALNRLY